MDWKNLFHMRPGFRISAGHDGGAEAGSFFAARNSGANKQNAFCGKGRVPAVGIGKQRIAAIDHDVARFEKRQNGINRLVDCVTSLDQHHDAARALESGDEFLDGMRTNDGRAFCFVVHELIDFRDGPVENGNFETVVVHVEDQILAHDGKSDQSDITSFRHNSPEGGGARSILTTDR